MHRRAFAFPVAAPIALELPPKLESWNARDHPDRIALRAWLAHVAERVTAIEPVSEGELALRLDVGLPQNVDPLWARDLDNYLFPVARQLPERYVSVWATKGRGERSYLRIGPAEEERAELAGWASFPVERSPRSDHTWKQAVATALRGATELGPGPVALQIALAVGSAVGWTNLWKPSIDGLEAILGSTYATPTWNPQDGRIVRLGFHRTVVPRLGRDAEATIWIRPALLEWDENAWLRDLSLSERAAYMEEHLARVLRSQGVVRQSAPAATRSPRERLQPVPRRRMLVEEAGVLVFLDDDDAYSAWLEATPRGFVLNALRSTPSEIPMLHSARCHTISGKPSAGRTWTCAQYLKACSTDRAALGRWLQANGRREARSCGTCVP